MKQPLISIILPVFNEQQNIPILYQEIKNIFSFKLSTYKHELIFIDDGSSDNSWPYIQHLSKSDSSIKGISFSRNFGYQAALSAGYDNAQGDALITMDTDLQHPPELIVDFIEKWQEGYKIVYARRIERKDKWLKRFTACVFHTVLNKISAIQIPAGVSDFRLIDKSVQLALTEYRTQTPFWRSIIAWSGFKSAYIDFAQPERLHGASQYTWSKLTKLAFDGITTFSVVPLRFAAWCGLFMIITGSSMALYLSIRILTHTVYYPLFKMLTIVIYLFMGVQFLLLWILGEYTGRIAQAQIKKPLYIIDESFNMEDKHALPSDALPLGKPSESLSRLS